MFKILNEQEMMKFTNKYLKEWKDDIEIVSSISYNGIIEYMVNHHYLVILKGNNVEISDLQ